jgi:CBS domain-containing protein
MAKVRDLMTRNPSVSTPDMDLIQVAKIMADQNVGSVPVVDTTGSGKVVGMVTDRDIVVRSVAEGRNPREIRVGDIMSSNVVTVREDADEDEVTRLMEKNQVRRIPVVDEMGNLCGIVAQADIALKTSDRVTGDTVQKISKPSERSSNVQ